MIRRKRQTYQTEPRPRHGSFHRQRSWNGHPRSHNRVPLFRCTLPASSPASLRHRRLLPFPGGVACAVKTRLWQFCTGRASSLPAGSPPVCSQRRAWSDVSSFDYVVTTMSRMPLQLCTDCVYHSVLTSRWLSWRSACCAVSRHHT